MPVFIASIIGATPLLMHRWTEQNEVEETTRKIHIERGDPREEAEKFAYRHTDGSLYLPGAAIARLLREAGGSHKQRGSRKSIKYIVPAAVIVITDMVILRDEQGHPLTDFEVDSRPVVIPTTKGRIMRHRPRLNAWGAEFSVDVDESMLDAKTVHQLLEEGGRKLGLGDFRPEKGGPFGRFAIVKWGELAQKKPSLVRRAA